MKYSWEPSPHFVGFIIKADNYYAEVRQEWTKRHYTQVWTWRAHHMNFVMDVQDTRFKKGVASTFEEAKEFCEQFLNTL